MKTLTKEEALHKAASYCSISEKCEVDIRLKFVSWGIAPEYHDGIVEYLIREGFISEERYAVAYAKDKFRFNAWGRVKIKMMLRSKGISNDAISLALEGIGEAEYEDVLIKLLSAKLRSMKYKSEYEKHGKLTQYAANKGFELGVIAKTIPKI